MRRRTKLSAQGIVDSAGKPDTVHDCGNHTDIIIAFAVGRKLNCSSSKMVCYLFVIRIDFLLQWVQMSAFSRR
jgi:hypothetical protein